MSKRSIVAAAVAVATVGASFALSPTAGASGAQVQATYVGAARTAAPQTYRLGTCYQQLDDDNGTGVVSQNFESKYDQYDSRGADDFYLSSSCQVRRVDVAGEYAGGSGPAKSANVTFYRDFNGAPGGVISNQPNLSVIGDGTGSFKITLDTGVGLTQGRYFVSVQINLNYDRGGEWLWRTNNYKRGFAAYWRDQGDGFGTGCVHYTKLSKCISGGQGPDFAFALAGN